MRLIGRTCATLLVFHCLLASSSAASKQPAPPFRPNERFATMPLLFEPNQGQAPERVKFISRGQGYTLYLQPQKALLNLGDRGSNRSVKQGRDGDAVRSMQFHLLEMELLGSNPKAKPEAQAPTPSKSNYFLGSNPKNWRANVPNYERARFRQVYPGIDVVYYGNQNQLEYDFEVAPGANPNAVQLRFKGANHISVDRSGDLVLKVNGREVRFQKPFVYQEVAGEKREIASAYQLKPGNQVGFRLGKYDASRKLVIDPILTYSRYFGGSGFDQAAGLVVHRSTNTAFVSGYTYSQNLPPGDTGNDRSCGVTVPCEAFSDLFIAKFDSNGSLMATTYIGGDDHEQVDFSGSLTLDAEGNVYMIGYSFSENFPIQNPLSGLLNGTGSIGFPPSSDAVVIKLSADLGTILYSSYYGGPASEFGHGIAVDASGNMIIVGSTNSGSGFPDTGEGTCTSQGGQNAFVVSLIPAGNSVNYSRCLSGNWLDSARGVAVNTFGDAFVTGYTASDDFPNSGASLQPVGGGVYTYPHSFLSSWEARRDGLGNTTVLALAHSPMQGSGVMLAGTRSGLYRATNHGLPVSGSFPAPGWSLISGSIPDSATFSAVAFSGPTAMAASGTDVYVAFDEGASFSFAPSPNVGEILALAAAPENVFYAAGTGGLARTDDGGSSWAPFGSGLPGGLPVGSIALHPTDSNIVYVSVEDVEAGGVFRGVGGSFLPLNSGLPTLSIRRVVIDPRAPNTLYATDGFQLFRTTNAGQSWIALQTPVGPDVVAVNPATSAVYVAGIEGVYVNHQNGGGYWELVSSNTPATLVLAFDPVNEPQRVYAGSQMYDAFIAQLDPGGFLMSSQNVGGNGYEQGMAVTVHSDSGTAYITGYTTSDDFPITESTIQAFPGSSNGGVDMFVASFGVELSLDFSTYLGGTGEDSARAIAVNPDNLGGIWVAGYAQAGRSEEEGGNPPLADPLQEPPTGKFGMYVAEIYPFSEGGTFLSFATFVSSGNFETAMGLDFDSNGNVLVAGHTSAANFPVYGDETTTPDAGLSDVVLFKIGRGEQPIPEPPVLTRVVSVNSADGSITVEGTGFLPGIIAWFNSGAMPTQFISPTLFKLYPQNDEGPTTFAEIWAFNQGNTTSSNTLRVELLYGGWNIGALVPSEAPMASAAMDVTIIGTNFKSDLTAMVNGAARPTTYLSPTQMRVRLGEADLAQSGLAQITVANSEGVRSLPASFAVTDFRLNVSRSELTLRAGQSITLDLEVMPVNGSYALDVALSCENVPAFIQCQLGTASLKPGSSGAKTTMRIADQTVATAVVQPVASPFKLALWLPLPAVVLLAGVTGRRRRATVALLVAVALLALVTMQGCGGTMAPQLNNSSSPNPVEANRAPGAYLIKVIGTANGVRHTSQVVVNVE